MLGIQTLKEELPNYSHLTPKEIEAVIIENLKAENYPHKIFERYRLRTICFDFQELSLVSILFYK